MFWAVFGAVHPVDGGDYAPIASGLSEENAREIVRRYNSWPELVAMLKKVVDGCLDYESAKTMNDASALLASAEKST